MTVQMRVIASLFVIVVTLGACMPIWFYNSRSPAGGYIMMIAGLFLALIFLVPARRRDG